MSIGQLPVASPTQTASPVVLFRAVPQWRGLAPTDDGTARQRAVADLQL